MTKDEAIESIKSAINFGKQRCLVSCPFYFLDKLNQTSCNLGGFSEQNGIAFYSKRTETCKALFKDEN